MTWKQVANSDTGDSDHFGGDDVDKISKLFSGVDVDDVSLNADIDFNGKPITFSQISEPSTPASGKIVYWLDSTTGRFSVKHSDGRVVILE